MSLALFALVVVILEVFVWRGQNLASRIALGLVTLFFWFLMLSIFRRQRPGIYQRAIAPHRKPWGALLDLNPYAVPKERIQNLRVLRAREVRGTQGYPPEHPAMIEFLLKDGSKVHLDAVDCGKEMMDHFLEYERQWDYVARLDRFPPLEYLKARSRSP